MKPLIIQSDLSILLDTNDPSFEILKGELIKFAEIDQSPNSIYIYKLTDLSIWNAISMGIKKEYVIDTLKGNSRFPVPQIVVQKISEWFNKYGVIELDSYSDDFHMLIVPCKELRELIKKNKDAAHVLGEENNNGFLIKYCNRGEIKHALMKSNISVHDNIGFSLGNPLKFSLRKKHRTEGFDIKVRYYQEDSSDAVFESGQGVVSLPCGSGKTLVGVNFMVKCQATTLIVTNSSASVKQWKQTLLDFTDLKEEDISCYTSDNKVISKVTICTYNMLAYRYKKEFTHLRKFLKENWGVLLLDEVHLMPAKMFRVVASLQACKRMALTATFVREDGKERDIYTLIGPKRYDKPWKDLEAEGYIATVKLQELRVPLTPEDEKRYRETREYQNRLNIAVMSENKCKAIKMLIERHPDAAILIIGQFTNQLETFAKELGIPMVCGKHKDHEREYYYNKMREGTLKQLFASSIANAALDIPGLSVVIQISFQGGSRSEESQRVGRCTRPKDEPAYFYTLVSKGTIEENQNFKRQRFLTSEGYKYEIKEMAA